MPFVQGFSSEGMLVHEHHSIKLLDQQLGNFGNLSSSQHKGQICLRLLRRKDRWIFGTMVESGPSSTGSAGRGSN